MILTTAYNCNRGGVGNLFYKVEIAYKVTITTSGATMLMKGCSTRYLYASVRCLLLNVIVLTSFSLSSERKLQKIKGQTHEVTSKEMLHSLGQAKKECWDRFLQETFEPEAYVETSDVDSR